MTRILEMVQGAETGHSTQQQTLPRWLQPEMQSAQPVSQTDALAELTKCLNLVAPSGMSKDERKVWLYGAFEHLEEHSIPTGPFLKAAFLARDLCDHPAKIVPAIIRESKEWSDNLRRSFPAKPAAKVPYENRLRGPIDREDREPEEMNPDTAAILANLKAKATTTRGAWSRTGEI